MLTPIDQYLDIRLSPRKRAASAAPGGGGSPPPGGTTKTQPPAEGPGHGRSVNPWETVEDHHSPWKVEVQVVEAHCSLHKMVEDHLDIQEVEEELLPGCNGNGNGNGRGGGQQPPRRGRGSVDIEGIDGYM